MFFSIVYKLEMEYWVLHCGCDGYLYLLFQRQMLKLSVILSVIMFIFSVVMNLDARDQSETDKNTKLSFIDKATLSNRELSNNRSWFHVLMVAVITFVTISMITKIRKMARQAYEMHDSWQTKSKDSEQL